jgi:hypothetical protein
LLPSEGFSKLTGREPSISFLFAKHLKQMAIMNFQLIAVLGEQASQSKPFGMGDRLLKGARLCSSAILRKSRNVNCST